MPKQAVAIHKVAKPVDPFSPAVLDAGRLYSSGHVAQDPTTGKLIDGDVAAQTYPARTTIAVAALPLGAAVEIEVVAN